MSCTVWNEVNLYVWIHLWNWNIYTNAKYIQGRTNICVLLHNMIELFTVRWLLRFNCIVVLYKVGYLLIKCKGNFTFSTSRDKHVYSKTMQIRRHFLFKKNLSSHPSKLHHQLYLRKIQRHLTVLNRKYTRWAEDLSSFLGLVLFLFHIYAACAFLQSTI